MKVKEDLFCFHMGNIISKNLKIINEFSLFQLKGMRFKKPSTLDFHPPILLLNDKHRFIIKKIMKLIDDYVSVILKGSRKTINLS